MITVNVKLFASLREQYPFCPLGKSMPVQLTENPCLARLAQQLNLPNAKIIFVNGIARTNDNYPLQDGDQIAMFPPLAGG